jgi:predicted nucleotidyltransferase
VNNVFQEVTQRFTDSPLVAFSYSGSNLYGLQTENSDLDMA